MMDVWIQSDALRYNKISLNTENTVYAIFTNIVIRKEIHIRIKAYELIQVQNLQSLGVTVDRKLKWNENIKSVKEKLPSSLSI